jgi:hypothetical protein
MKRTFTTTTFALALLGLAACKGGGGDSVKLIPDAATMVGGVDMKGLVGSKAYTDNKALLETGETKEMMDAATACNLGTDKWKSITFGADQAKNQFAVVVNADGIGKDENLNCIAGKIKEKQGKDPWKLEEKEGKKVLTMEGDEGTGYVVNENTLVVASKDWAAAVKELVDGKGKSAFDGALKDVIGRADTSKHIWVAGTIPAEMTKEGPAAGAKDVAGDADLSNGLAVKASVGFASADDAKKKAEELQKQFDGVKGAASGMGVPQAAVDSVKIEAKDTAVTVTASISADDMKKVQETVMKGMM